ncbi:hypothetical protein WL51_19330 [Burkholderia ubonensis]|uniref:hypothetical protein n=1 Tax=Burkholderia ubonensis TaxID=101571 RepID=UPI000751F944|nr:hypothetical protein [Burkholderia ubonensis]KWC36269.1 hypothetical protein WL51_19330 [Burkholderia ubonensis]
MNDDQINVLWAVFGYIGENWGTASTCTMPQAQFQQVLQWQIQRDPAYKNDYLATVTEYQLLLRQYGSPAAALARLFAENELPDPKLPDVANHVLLEFMRWNVAFGGFKTFGYENYNGWMGGGSYLTQPPPYRALPGEHVVSGPTAGGRYV